MYRIFIFSIIVLTYSFTREIDTETEYIIYTSLELKESADILCDYYNNPYNYGYSNNNFDITLNTEVITSDIVTPENFNSYIFSNYENINGNFESLEYLLIIGDENIIAPFKFQNIAASDDYFSTYIFSLNTFPTPSLKTGSMLVDNNYDTNLIINNIIEYINNPFEGSWKSESLLIADDIYKNGKQIYEEIVHTQYSNIIYNKLNDKMNLSCLYGNDYPRQESADWFIQPELNNKIIQKINNGLSLINYIGHGTSNILADEDILTHSDINLISIANNKLPIWVIGTCSFGNYLNQNCFAEDLLKKGDAAIAVVSTTYNVSYDNNWSFINDFYDNLENALHNETNLTRIGNIFFNSKSILCNNYIFHLFGDPAMPLNIAKSSNSLVNNINQIDVGTINSINSNNGSLSTMKISYEDISKTINYLDENNINQSFTYYTPGEVLFYDAFYNNIEFILPLNVNLNRSAEINFHNDYNNLIQIIPNISLSLNTPYDFENLEGPSISIMHKDKLMFDDDVIYPPYNIKIIIEDEEPINLSGINNNNIRIWLDENDNNSIILNDLFIPTDNANNYEGYIDFNLKDAFHLNNYNTINIQAWDILGESNVLNLNLNIFNDDDEIYNVYNFPNPFNSETYFTFHYSESENLDAQIEIFTLNGNKVKTISSTNLQPSNGTFYKIEQSWNGQDNNNNKLINGTYLYKLSLRLSSNNKLIHNNIYKITKIDWYEENSPSFC